MSCVASCRAAGPREAVPCASIAEAIGMGDRLGGWRNTSQRIRMSLMVGIAISRTGRGREAVDTEKPSHEAFNSVNDELRP